MSHSYTALNDGEAGAHVDPSRPGAVLTVSLLPTEVRPQPQCDLGEWYFILYVPQKKPGLLTTPLCDLKTGFLRKARYIFWHPSFTSILRSHICEQQPLLVYSHIQSYNDTMWLIDTETFRLESFQGGSPRYAVLSHTWGPDEVTFADFHDQHKTTRDKKAGYHKIKLTCEQARKDGIKYAWIDTCRINKESSAELSEAINSMFKWYRLATVCYAYLEDFPQNEESVDLSLLPGCKWFSRGWTLQELLAPRDLMFFVPHEESWRDIGRKEALSQVLEQITKIPGEILLKQTALETVSVAARMSWAARRQTTREEDLAYCLMGIFNVNMPLLYGEGSKAFIRLQEEIMRETRDDSLFA